MKLYLILLYMYKIYLYLYTYFMYNITFESASPSQALYNLFSENEY